MHQVQARQIKITAVHMLLLLAVTTGWNHGNIDNAIHWPDGTEQSVNDARKEFYDYLYTNLVSFDIPNAGTLGFAVGDDSNNEEPDGLSTGILEPTIDLSLESKIRYPWTKDIPKDIYLEYVLPFSIANEARTNIRPLLKQTLTSTIDRLLQDPNNTDINDVVHAVNTDLWPLLGNITFKSGQTPLIFDPMSIIAFKYASCTGLSILLIHALRCLGVPCRLVGTPAWNGDTEKGNHNWVEFYSPSHKEDDKWIFLESAPAYGGIPDINPNPCSFWFCDTDHFDGATKVYATRLDKLQSNHVYYPLAWDDTNHDIPGEDRTMIYTNICSSCDRDDSSYVSDK